MADVTPVSSSEQQCPFCETTITKGCKNETDLRILARLRLSIPIKCTMSGKGCNWEGEISQFWEHVSLCDHFPRPCPYDCDPNVYMPKKILRAHVHDKCPMKSIPCEYKWAGCDAILNRKEMPVHMKDYALIHNELLVKAAKGYKTKISELQSEILQLRDTSSNSANTPTTNDGGSPYPKKRKVTFSQNPDIISDGGVSTVTSQTLPTSATSSSDALSIDQQANNGGDNNNSYTTESIDDKPKTMISPRKDQIPIDSPIVQYAVNMEKLEKPFKGCPAHLCRYHKADRRTLMVKCQDCDTWYHSMCVKIPNYKLKTMTEYTCPLCRHN